MFYGTDNIPWDISGHSPHLVLLQLIACYTFDHMLSWFWFVVDVKQMRSSRNFCVDIVLLVIILGIAAYLYKFVLPFSLYKQTKQHVAIRVLLKILLNLCQGWFFKKIPRVYWGLLQQSSFLKSGWNFLNLTLNCGIILENFEIWSKFRPNWCLPP